MVNPVRGVHEFGLAQSGQRMEAMVIFFTSRSGDPCLPGAEPSP